MEPRSLVIGGAGFIGATLCRALLKQGHFVICIDDLSTGSRENINDIKSPRFIFRSMDILDIGPHNITNKLDYVFNLACPASPVHYAKDPVRTLNICFTGTQNALNIARESNAKLIFTSTSEIYGEPKVHPQTENYRGNVTTIGPRACYDEGKRVAETLITSFCDMYGVDYSIARVFNTYGPRLNAEDGRVICNFVHQALDGQALTIYGDGSQTRSFCYVDDTVDCLLRLAFSKEHGPINIGNPEEYTILQAANIINKLCGNTTPHTYVSLPKDDPTRRCPDISLAIRKLGWSPKTTFEEGLKETIKGVQACITFRSVLHDSSSAKLH